MTVLLYFAGLIIGIAIFLYIYSTIQDGKEKLGEITGKKKPEKTIDPDKLTVANRMKRAPGERLCPVCASSLSKYEALYATKIEEENKIFIYGCRYCYKEEENPDSIKRNEF